MEIEAITLKLFDLSYKQIKIQNLYYKSPMDDQIEQILKKQQQQGEKVSLNSLRHRPRQKQQNIDEETLTRLQRLKKFALNDASFLTEKLNNHYCSLCGRINIVTNVLLDHRPRRKTDGAIAIDIKSNYIKLNLEREKIRYVQRDGGVEVQYRWRCECGMPIGYTALNYDEFEEARKDENFEGSNKPYFYAYEDALIEKMKESKVISELITYKETILLHLKRKTKK